MTIPQSELQELFPKFAAPLVNGEAAKRFGEPVAKQLAQTFWQMMIDGPKSEAYLWKSFGESFTPDDVAMLRRCFYEEMKPSISLETSIASPGVSLPSATAARIAALAATASAGRLILGNANMTGLSRRAGAIRSRTILAAVISPSRAAVRTALTMFSASFCMSFSARSVVL